MMSRTGSLDLGFDDSASHHFDTLRAMTVLGIIATIVGIAALVVLVVRAFRSRARAGHPTYSLFDYLLGAVVVAAMVALFLISTVSG
jgi:hypothetical protein